MKLGSNELGFNEQIFQSQMIIYYKNEPGYSEPWLDKWTNLVGTKLFIIAKYDCVYFLDSELK